ncbi:MAG TPA: arginase family protein [archaeon]|nr:arginase family protein [archaeon]
MSGVTSFEQLQALFVKPEKTPARIKFGNPPGLPTFDESKVVVFGVPFDDTATFGKGTSKGPEGMRHVSARQIETFVFDENVDVYEKTPVFDLGDLKLNALLSEKERELLFSENAPESKHAAVLEKLEEVLSQFAALRHATQFIRSRNKIPLMLGGEHTLSFWPLLALSKENPVVIHFDAHRDAYNEYFGMKYCHTTWVHRYLEEARAPGTDFVQVGIRQGNKEEHDFANSSGIATFHTTHLRESPGEVVKWIKHKTKGRNVYVSFDIDALDISYTPCTGTPEPFGLTPEEAVMVLKAIDSSATLIGADMTEVAVKNNDYRESTTAVQLLLRLLARDYVK